MNARANTQTRKKNDTFKDAINQLNEAAKDRQSDLQQAVEHQYTDFKQAVTDALGSVNASGKSYLGGVKKKTEDAIGDTEKNLKVTADILDEKLRQDPWLYVGAAAVGAFVLGFSFAQGRGKKTKNLSRS